MNPWIVNLLRSAGSGGGYAPPLTGRTLFAPLKSSLVLSEGTGAPTFTRATKAWRFNELGLLQEVPSGCAVFDGARLIRNIAPKSEGVNAGWSLGGVTASDANTLLESSGGTVHKISTSTTGAGTFLMVVYLKRGVGSDRHVRLEISDGSYIARVNFDIDTGGVSSTAQSGTFSLASYGAAATLDSEGYRRFYIRVVASAETTISFYPVRMLSALNGSISYSGDGTSTILVKRVEIHNVTGYDASYVPEYVSVGVASTPFFGAGVDGAKYYETDWQGAPIPAANLLGFRKETAATNNLLYCRDLSNAAWSTKTNITANKTATGLDGIANAATTLTATASDAIILQPITLSSAARCASAYVKRRTGTGTISFTQDGGSSWTDITSQINSSAYSRVQITSTLANPSVGFKIGTSGDAIDVDCVQNEAGSVATSPIVTTTATVTRNADSLTYQTASNWSDTAGTAFVEVAPLAYSGGAIGSATNGLLLSTSNSGATAYDGTNSANGPSGTPGSSEKLAFRWGSSAMTVSSGGVIGTPGTYDGGMELSSIGVGSSAAGCFRNAAIYNYAMTDAELQAVTA